MQCPLMRLRKGHIDAVVTAATMQLYPIILGRAHYSLKATPSAARKEGSNEDVLTMGSAGMQVKPIGLS